MSSAGASLYVTDNFSEPVSAQHNFVNNFDLDHPEDAMSAYQRIMHEHTKRQLSTATNSAHRRTGMVQSTDANRAGSVSSTDS
ncbi:hypothetical protein BU25DRAFT_343382 [Macroventuria anomochaeta]|uniref:Uncharacterized protein n=1 Tax=Macroventuria anomochaeta TaxID=301207 RepID=A0ACB6RYS1_9PLEO|nr:uncharacterized protein BU25DRAFT_343382 [Macroventuria anomochaeta]KAF2626575.1 hypothetical protein BU25DRAFT_343382 [Macroventuria anomochaeta]